MGNFVDKVKDFMGIGLEDEYEYENEYGYEEDKEVKYIEGDGGAMHNEVNDIKNNNNIVSLHTNNSIMKIVIHEPKSYEEAPKIVDDLKSNKVVVVNFEDLDLNLKRQIFDFISGALYSIEGKIQKVTTDIFIVAPKTVYIDGLKDELKNKGIFTW